MLKEFHLTTEAFNPNSNSELQAPPNTSGLRLHHGEVAAVARRPVITEERKMVYRGRFDETWYAEKCQTWKMDQYSWDIDQFRFNEK